MKASRFNYKTTAKNTGDLLLYNTRTGAFISVDASEANAFEAALSKPDDLELTDPLLKTLVEDGFVINDSFDETKLILERNRIGINDPNRLDVFVLPNMNCNFKCTYCYESHHKGEISTETIRRLISWFQQTIPNFKIVNLCWFGGEPLISYDKVVTIQRKVHNICDKAGVEFSSHMTTNGYLLSENRARELVALGLNRYQITIDGNAETHDKQRPLRGGGSSFHRVLNNMITLVNVNPRVKVTLRVNYNDLTFDTVPDLLREIPENVRGQIELDCQRIFGKNGANIQPIYPIKQTASKLEQFYSLSKEMGFIVTMRSISPYELTYCYADRKYEYLFTYEGDLFKCTLSSFRSEDRLGFVTEEGTIQWENDRAYEWNSAPEFEEKCNDCVYMPLCMGGCRYKKVHQGTTGVSCTAQFAGIEQRLQQRYKGGIT